MKNQMSRFEEQKTKNSKKYFSNTEPAWATAHVFPGMLCSRSQNQRDEPCSNEKLNKGCFPKPPFSLAIEDLKEYFLPKNVLFPFFLENR